MVNAVADEIARVPLFTGLDPDALAAVARVARKRWCKARDRVVSEGDAGGSLFLITSGYFKAATLNATGRETLFSIMGPGEVFGELSVLDGEPRSATVTALQPGTLEVIDQHALFELLHSSPAVSIQILKTLCKRVRALSVRCEELSSMPIPARLAQAILGLAERHGRQEGGEVRIPVRISQQDLGSLAGATRESVNKQLGTWGEAMVRAENGCLVITDLEALRSLVRAHQPTFQSESSLEASR